MMGIVGMVKELGKAMQFICSLEFWRMAVFWTLSLLVSYWHLLFAPKSKSFPRCAPATTPIKPICIITGATSGLGAAAAYALSKEGFCVVLVGRSSHLLSKTLGEIKSLNKDAHLKAFQVDMSSFQSIFNFKGSLQQWLLDSNMHPSVQLLINNAGILATSYRLTAEGYDQMMATNYIGAFCLTKLLLPLLRNSPVPSRIVNVTSFTHRNVFNMQVDKETVSGNCFSRTKPYPCARIYENSKLCLLLFSYELHRQLSSMEKSHRVSVMTYLEYTFLVERVEPLTLQRFRKTENLHRNFGPLHVIYFCSHSLLLRLRKLPLPRVFDCNREEFCSSTKRRERIWI